MFLKSLLKPNATVAKFLVLVLIAGFIAFGFLDFFKPVIKYLDSDPLAIELQGTRLSVYTFLKATFSIILCFWIASILSEFGEKRIRKITPLGPSNRALVTKAYQIGIYLIAGLVALNMLGIDLTALTVAGGAIGIGIGFGLQKITSNFISGLILLLEKSVEEGDMVELNDGLFGIVRYTGARYTLVETLENRELMIPNEDFITNRVTNWTFSNTIGRVDIEVGVAYGTDLDKAYEIILQAAVDYPKASKTNPPQCFLDGFGDSSVDFILHFWVDDVTKGWREPKSDVLFRIWRELKKNGIEIPFPQRDLHIKSDATKSVPDK